MAALTPVTHSNWRPTKWSLDVIDARLAAMHVTRFCKDRSAEVTGEPMQQLNIEQTSKLTTYPVGDNGEVNEQSPPATNVALTIDRYREATIKIRDDYDLQVKLAGRKTWAALQGAAHAEDLEDTLLALETGVAAAQLENVAGSIVDAVLLRSKGSLDAADAPGNNRYILVSSNQQVQIMSDDRFSSYLFVGPGALPVTQGDLKPIYGMMTLWSTRVRRRTISGTPRTINMAWQKDAIVKAVQQSVKTKLVQVDAAYKLITTQLYGTVAQRLTEIYLMRTADS